MRTSSRASILDAAIRVVNRDGLTAVTFESVATEAGVTRGGMLYHFVSRDALVQAINQHLAEQWEASLVKYAGKPFEETTQDERHVAYVRNSANGATRAELLFLLEFSGNPELAAPWDSIIERWAAPEPRALDEPQAMVRFIARLAADGLWSHAFISNRSMSAAARQRVTAAVADLVGTPSRGVATVNAPEAASRQRPRRGKAGA